MLIGLRFLLLFALIGCGITMLSYLFTRNPRFLKFTAMIAKVTAVAVLLVIGLYVLERGL